MTPTTNPHVHASRVPLRWRLAAAALGGLLLGAQASAGTVSRSEFDAFMSMASGGGKHTIGFGSGGTPVITRGVPGPTSVGNMNISTAGGAPAATGTAKFPLPGGRSASIPVRQPLTKASAGLAIARFATKLAFPLTVGMAAYDLATELGYKHEYDEEDKENRFYTEETNCSPIGGLCYRYNFRNTGWHSTPSGGCAAGIGQGQTSGYGWATYTGVAAVSETGCKFTTDRPFTTDWQTMLRDTVTPVTMRNYTTDELLAQEIADQSGWPDAAGRALADSINAGQPVTTEGDVQTPPGQTTVPGPTTTKTRVDPATGNTITTTTQTTIKIDIGSAGQVTVTEKTTQTEKEVTPGGEVVREEQVFQEEKEVEPEESQQCEEGSTSVECAQLDTPEEEMPTATRALTFVEEALGFGSGSCPAPIVQTYRGTSVTVFNYAKACEYLSGPVRAIVLTLAAFMAFVILMPAKVE